MKSSLKSARPLLPRLVTSLPGPRARAIIERDDNALSPSYTRCYPLVAARGEGALIEDVDGNRFLDFNAGIAVCSTGHCHPRVVEAIQKQAARLIHMSGTDFYYENMVELAERLIASAPGGGPRKVSFSNSGAEAIECALKLARYYTRRDKFIAFFGGFHGRTMGALSATASKAVQRQGFGPLVPGFFHVPYPTPHEAGGTLDAIDRLFHTTAPASEVAAFLFEPVQGEGGYIVPPRGFFRELAALAEQHGILMIADEVQSGNGRTGRMWASEHFGVEPDILATAKGIASGLPLGATIARAEVMNWPRGAHASTFGGNPVAVAAALVTLELLESGLMDNAARLGDYLMERLRSWPARYPIVHDVRGLGLMIGIEFERGRDSVVQFAFERGLLVLGAGRSTIRLSPPLVITREQADFALDTLEECLEIVQERGGEEDERPACSTAA